MPKPLVFILSLSVLLRIAYPLLVLFTTQTLVSFHSRDTISYILPAQEILSHWSFSIDGIPDIYRTPGYSLLMVPGLMFNHLELWIISLQIVMSLVTVWMVFKITDLVFRNRTVSLVAAGLYAIDPQAIFYVGELSTETSFTFILVAGLYFFLDYLVRARLTTLLASAVLFSAATYIRPIGIYLPYALTGFLVVALLTRKLRSPNALVHLAFFAAVAFGLTFTWQVRNRIETGYPGFSTISGVSAYYYQAAAVRAKLESRPYLDIQKELGYVEELYLTEHPRERKENQAVHFVSIEKEGIKIVGENLCTYIPIHIGGIVRIFLDPGATGFLRVLKLGGDIDALIGVAVSGGLLKAILYFAHNRPLVFWSNMALGLVLIVYYLGACICLLWRGSNQGLFLVLLLLVVAYFILISGGPNGVSRFRHPIMPIISIFAASGLFTLRQKALARWDI